MSFNGWTLALQTVNFLILVWLLRRFLYKPVRDVIAQRHAATDAALAEAEAKLAQAEAEKKLLDEARTKIEDERRAALAGAEKQADAQRKAAAKEAEAAATALIADATKKAAEVRATEETALRKDLGDTAVAIARSILRGTTDSGLDAVFRDRVLKRFDALPPAAKDGAKPGGAPVQLVVRTAAPLSDTDKAAWSAELRRRSGETVTVAFLTDPDLVAGAELLLPHASVRFAWADQLKDAGDVIAATGSAA